MTQEEDRKGCLMAMVADKYAKLIQAWSKKYIPDNILYWEGSDFGREKETHTTILYGFINDLTLASVSKIIGDTKPFKIRVVGTNVFNNPQYDVITLKVESPELTRLNQLAKQFPHESKYPQYNPHITLSYVLPGYGKKYNNIPAKSITSVVCDSIMYSGIDHQKTTHNLFEAIDTAPPTAIHQQATDQSLTPDFVNFVKNIENDMKRGFVNGKWYPHESVEGGTKTIAYGHKLKSTESHKFDGGIDDREATKLLVKDLLEAKDKVQKYIDQKYKIHLILDKKQMEILTELTFNIGNPAQFPKFIDAVLRKDWEIAKKEYKRYYKSPSGEWKELSRRNKLIYNKYFNQ